jgi:hypothetical protein
MTHGRQAPQTADAQQSVARLYESTPTSFHLRDEDSVRRMFDGLELVEPGMTTVTGWHPDPDEQGNPPQDALLAVVGRKP